MSIKIKKREEKRDTSLGRFVMVAIIPLLLAYLAGCCTGQTVKIENESVKGQLDSLQIKYDVLILEKANLDSLNKLEITFFQELAAWSDKLDEEARKLGDEGKNIARSGEDLDDWNTEREEFFGTWKADIDELEENTIDNAKVFKASEAWENKVENSSNLLNDLRKLWDRRLKLLILKEGLETQNQGITTLTDQLDSKEDALDDLDDQLDEKNDNLRDLRSDLKATQRQLEDCQASKSGVVQTSTEKEIDNSGHVIAIKQEVKAIRDEVIPKMNVNFWTRDRDKLEELRIQLAGKVTSIESAVNEVE